MLFTVPHLKIDKTHNQEVNCMNWAPDSEKLVTCSKDQTIKVNTFLYFHLPISIHSFPYLNSLLT